MKNIVVFILFLLFCNHCYPTPQAADRLIYNNDTIRIYPFILDKYVNASPDKELIYSQIKESFVLSTGCWRGFIAVFEIRNDSLFLQKAYGEKAIDLSVIFGKPDNIFVDWYSGTLTSPKNLLIYEHDGWGGFYEYETDFSFKNGILKKVEEFHNKIVPSIYTDSSSDTLMNFIKSNIDYTKIKIPKQKIRVIVRIDDVDENGRIDKVTVVRGHDGYNEEAIRVIKLIPQWQMIIRRGKKVHRPWTVPVFFTPSH